jgi:hypothetical protein
MKLTAMVAAAALAAALSGPARAEEATPVGVDAGNSVNLCKQKLAPCQASTFWCSASTVARLENGADGIELKGLSPGTTLCTVLAFDKSRHVLSVTVKGTAPPKETAAR